jgi:hypothetical protein
LKALWRRYLLGGGMPSAIAVIAVVAGTPLAPAATLWTARQRAAPGTGTGPDAATLRSATAMALGFAGSALLSLGVDLTPSAALAPHKLPSASWMPGGFLRGRLLPIGTAYLALAFLGAWALVGQSAARAAVRTGQGRG